MMGFLFTSRIMVAKEAHTSSSVKDLIVAASGVDDAQWEGTYAKLTGSNSFFNLGLLSPFVRGSFVTILLVTSNATIHNKF